MPVLAHLTFFSMQGLVGVEFVQRSVWHYRSQNTQLGQLCAIHKHVGAFDTAVAASSAILLTASRGRASSCW